MSDGVYTLSEGGGGGGRNNLPRNALNAMNQHFSFFIADFFDPKNAFVENAFDVLKKFHQI